MSKRSPSSANAIRQVWSGFPLSQRDYQNDSANAERFVLMHRHQVRYCPKLEHWYVWDGKRWVGDNRTLAMRLAKRTGVAMLTAAASEGDDAKRFAKSSNNRQSLENMLALAAVHPDLAIDPSELDSHPMLLNCNNGTLDLRTMRLSPHEPSQMLTQLCPVDYVPGSASPLWEKFLESVMPDAEHRQFLQRCFGYCLTAETREQVFVICVGGGANGKSTLLEVVQSILGEDYSIQGSPDLLVDKPKDSHPTNRMDLFGRRLVICTETELDQKLAESQLKQLTGSDTVRGRKMRQDNWQFQTTQKLILCTNHMPKLSAGDDALWRRVIVVLFTQRFWNPASGDSGPESHRQDKSLPKRLRAEAVAILAWMVDGCRDWQAGGLRIPPSLREAAIQQRFKNDVLRQFIESRCDVGSSFSVAASVLQNAFKDFCIELGEPTISPQKFSEQITAMKFQRTQNNSRFYLGLRLKETASK